MNISLEDEDTIFDPNEYGDGKGRDEEGDLTYYLKLSMRVNEFFGKAPEGTEDGTRKLIEGYR